MKKILFIVCILLFSISFAFENENIIKAGVKYDEASARIEAFSGVEKKIDKDIFMSFRKDINRDENLKFIENKITDTKIDRLLCPFYIQNTLASYAIVYFKIPQYTFYYNILGNLVKFDIVYENDEYKKIIGYSRFGNLISIAFEIEDGEQFVYNSNGKLVAHWKNNELLNKNNKIPRVLKMKRGV